MKRWLLNYNLSKQNSEKILLYASLFHRQSKPATFEIIQTQNQFAINLYGFVEY